ncbi:Coiled-coil domain-containing protein 43 [Orchesella cincta]|uniref:Coiled-coil domain-containing protein 43 n=1 Tax=Orchesella cincta TaxID=48709 RepID=A0A1D2N4X9_ORCCI|nr:Coiled-coil domain-containing protein 43 [Orchesella cincta]
MAASLGEGDDFDTWISDKFKALNTDEAVFAPYVKSIVEGDESLEEKIDALDGILAELADGNFDVEAFRQEILSRWDLEQMRKKSAAVVNGSGCLNGGTDLESKLQSILKMTDELTGAKSTAADQAIDNKGTKNLAQAPDSELRAAILSQYKDDSDSDSDDQGNGAVPKRSVPSGSGGGAGLERNTNSERVLNEMKDRRDQEKADAATKRQKDKEDRAKQKQQAQDRKDKAKKKATKVERKTR